MNILSLLSNAFLPVVLTVAGIFFLFAPYDKIQKVFPHITSEKTVKICAVVILLCGIGSCILLLLNFI